VANKGACCTRKRLLSTATNSQSLAARSLAECVAGEEPRFYGDSAYRGKAQREHLKALAPRAKDFNDKRAYKNAPLSSMPTRKPTGGSPVSVPRSSTRF